MLATVDDVEGGDWGEESVGGLARELGDVVIEGNIVFCCASPGQTQRDRKDGIGSQLALAPAVLIFGAVQLLDHEFVELSLLSNILAYEYRKLKPMRAGRMISLTFLTAF